MKSKEKTKWEEAIQEEKNCFDKNNTWRLVPEKYAQSKKVITSRWVFKKKEDGRYRARVVSKGVSAKEKVTRLQ